MKIQQLKIMNSNKINISHNKNLNIQGNNITNQTFIGHPYSTFQKVDFSLRKTNKYKEILLGDKTIEGPLLRNVILNEVFNKFIYISKVNSFLPTVRICGYFSSLSSIRQKSETNDFALLELEEKEKVIKMVKMGFKVKIILILDASIILNMAYTCEQYIERCKDLYRSIQNLEKKYPNLQIVVNSMENVTCGYIFDSLLVVQTDKYDINARTLSYNNTLIHSNKHVVECEIKSFDKAFYELLWHMNSEKEFYQFENTSDFVFEVSKIRFQNYLKSKE